MTIFQWPWTQVCVVPITDYASRFLASKQIKLSILNQSVQYTFKVCVMRFTLYSQGAR